MPVKVLYVTSSLIEAEIIGKLRSLTLSENHYRSGKIDLQLLVSGVGSIATAWAMKKWIAENGKPDFAINAGIAGSFNDDLDIGSVVIPVTDCFADAGIEDGDRFLTLSEAGLSEADDFPFRSGLLHAGKREIDLMAGLLKPVNAITVNTASGSAATIDKLVRKFNPDIETMEGATFFYICSVEFIPFIAVRAISNRVEQRNKNNWNISLALEKLSVKMDEIILTLDRGD